MAEEIREEGTVIQTGDGTATVSVVRSEACGHCGARIVCRASGEEVPRVTVMDSLGAKPGDRVLISAPGRNILLASCLLYGAPLLLLLIGIALGNRMFPNNRELYGTLLGIGFCALYYCVVRIKTGDSRPGSRFMPRIVKIL